MSGTDSNLLQWRVITVKVRVDSFTQGALMSEVEELISQGHRRIALDLRSNRFLSLPMIKFSVETAHKLTKSGGQMALIGCPQRTKRHFEIYGSIAEILFVRMEDELPGMNRRFEPEL